MNALWTVQDARNGDCDLCEVGSPKPIAPSADSFSPSPPDMADGLAQAYAKMGGDLGFTDWAAKNPNLVYPQMIKMGIAITAKTSPPTLPNLDDLTDEDIATLPSDQLKLILLKSVGVTKKSELAALKD